MKNDTFEQTKDDASDRGDASVEASDFEAFPENLETPQAGMVLLTERVARLARICERLARDNQALSEELAELRAERDALFEKNEQSRARIEAMIVRLRSLEQTS